jgi:hypothetical protein
MGKNGSKLSNGRRLHDLKFVVATQMLDHIGVSMYSKYPKAIGELVVNGYDADANHVLVDIRPSEDRITIEDNGEGMGERDIREGYMFLGSGQKRAIARTAIYHRLPIGSKGIGKLAGFGIARRIEVKTIKNGTALEFCLDRNELENAQRMGKLNEPILDRAPMQLKEFDAKGLSNGTTVVLRKLRAECGKIEVDKVIAHLAHELPLGMNFRVVVNGRVCEPKHIPASRRIPIDHEDPVCGRIIGEVIVAKKMLSKPGVFTTVRGRVVGEPSLFDLSPTSFTYHIGDLIAGSVEVADFDPEDKTDAMPVIKTDREGFVATHPKYIAYANYMTEVLMDICREEEKKRQARREAEKKAKVHEAIRQVAEDFNAYDEFLKRQARQYSVVRGRQDEAGIRVMRPDLAIETKRRLGRHREHTPIPPKLMREIKAILGSGRLRFRNQIYEIKPHPLGQDFPECDIRPEQSLILVNLDHPAYEQGVEEECVEITVFRAIAARFALDESESPDEMYDKLDEMIRFHAGRSKDRRGKRKQELQKDSLSGDIILA